MAETEKFQPKLITFKGARLAFARIHKAEQRTGRDGKPKGEAKFSCTILLDPSNQEHAATIAEIKAEAARALDHRFGKGVWSPQWPNFYLPFGMGNDLPKLGKKIYDGFADMFYLKLSDKNRPNLLNRDGKAVVEGDPQCPYSGCYVAGTTTLYSYDNESRGAGANLRTLVFMRDGAAFGGGAANAEQEFAAIGDLGNEPPAGAPAGGADPFAI
jgi:hypothetical protein